MTAVRYTNERLDHLGIVAGVCRDIGIAPYLDALDDQYHERVSMGTAVVAMILNGLGFSNRRMYLTPQFFANKPLDVLLGPGIMAEDLNDDCLGRALDWVAAHDPTALFAGVALQARQRVGIAVTQLHGDTTSFAVSGDYRPEAGEADAHAIAITYGYSRDHRADLKQWALALITTNDGDIPTWYQALDGNSSDKATIVAAHIACVQQMRDASEDPGWAIADSALYSAANLRQLNAAHVAWITRVPETLGLAKAAVARTDAPWQAGAKEGTWWWSQEQELSQGTERWIIVRTQQAEERVRATFARQATKQIATWEKKAWHLSHEWFACEADARQAATHLLRNAPPWMTSTMEVTAQAKHARPGRPTKGAQTTTQWQVRVTLHTDTSRQEAEIRQRACFILATNHLDEPADAILARYKEQGGVERGFRFLKDPLFLASSVFLKKPERIVALSLVMVLCLLVYRLAEWRLRTQLAVTGQTIPDQLHHPTQRPTMRWVFQCFEGIDRLAIQDPGGGITCLMLGLTALHQQILSLLGPAFCEIYQIT